jgi:hypothetical protein
MFCWTRIPATLALFLMVAAVCPTRRTAHALASTAISASAKPDDTDEENSRLIATADFNRDGIADVAKIIPHHGNRTDQSVLEVSFGNKDGSFRTVMNRFLVLHNPRVIATGDFNRDGNADLLIGSADGSLIGLFGDGKGNLRFAGEVAHVGSAVSIAVGDFNRDGILDVAVSDFRGNAVAVLLGTGGGLFRTGWSFALPQRGTKYYLMAADFNRDNIADLVITSGEENAYIVMLGNGNGTFTYAPEMSNIRDPYSYCPT